MKWLDTDSKKGLFFVMLGILGYTTIRLLTKKEFSFLYGIPGIFLMFGSIHLFFTAEHRKLRRMFKVALLGLICIYIFFLLFEFF